MRGRFQTFLWTVLWNKKSLQEINVNTPTSYLRGSASFCSKNTLVDGCVLFCFKSNTKRVPLEGVFQWWIDVETWTVTFLRFFSKFGKAQKVSLLKPVHYKDSSSNFLNVPWFVELYVHDWWFLLVKIPWRNVLDSAVVEGESMLNKDTACPGFCCFSQASTVTTEKQVVFEKFAQMRKDHTRIRSRVDCTRGVADVFS